jgi:hypothetical protein
LPSQGSTTDARPHGDPAFNADRKVARIRRTIVPFSVATVVIIP